MAGRPARARTRRAPSPSATARHALSVTSTAPIAAAHVPARIASLSCEYQPSSAIGWRGRVERLAADRRVRTERPRASCGRAGRRAPARVHVLEELDVVGGVHAQHRFEPVRGRARRIGPMPAAAIAARMRSARSGTSGGSIMRPWSWNGWRGMVLAVRVGGEREHARSCSTARRRGDRRPYAIRPVPSRA